MSHLWLGTPFIWISISMYIDTGTAKVPMFFKIGVRVQGLTSEIWNLPLSLLEDTCLVLSHNCTYIKVLNNWDWCILTTNWIFKNLFCTFNRLPFSKTFSGCLETKNKHIPFHMLLLILLFWFHSSFLFEL